MRLKTEGLLGKGLLWFPASLPGKKAARATGRELVGFGIRGDSFQFLLPASAPTGSITLFGIHGKKRIEIPLGPFAAGAHLVDMPKLAPGVYSLWISLGPFSGSAHLVHTGKRTTLMPRHPVARSKGSLA